MPAAIKVTRTPPTPEALRALARSGKDATQNVRLSMVALVLEGVGRAEAGRTGGMDRQAVRDWLHRYNAEGPEGLRDRPRGGTACFLDGGQLAVVRGWMESDPEWSAMAWFGGAFAIFAGRSRRPSEWLMRTGAFAGCSGGRGFASFRGARSICGAVRGRGRRSGPGSGLS